MIKSISIALGLSIVANLALLFIFRGLVIDPAMPLPILVPPAIALFSFGGGVAGIIVYAVMRLLLRHPNTPYTWVAAVAFVVSCVPDYLIVGQTTGKFAGATWSSALLLMAMHAVEALIVVWAMTTKWGPRATS